MKKFFNLMPGPCTDGYCIVKQLHLLNDISSMLYIKSLFYCFKIKASFHIK